MFFKLWSAEGQVVSLSLFGFPWVDGLKQEGSDWHECDRLLLLPKNAHSPPCKLLTKCWLSAYISRAWSVSCSHTAKVATKAVRRHTGGYAVCQWRRPKIPSRSESTASATGSTPLLDVTGWPCCNSKSQAHPWTHLLGPLLVHSRWSTWVLVVFWQRLWSFGRHLSTHESRSTRILVCQAA